MRAMKTLLWLVVAAVLIGFTYANPDPIAVRIWPGLIWETRAPGLVIGALAIGFIPTWLILRATRWRLTRRIATLEAMLASQTPMIDPVGTAYRPADPVTPAMPQDYR